MLICFNNNDTELLNEIKIKKDVLIKSKFKLMHKAVSKSTFNKGVRPSLDHKLISGFKEEGINGTRKVIVHGYHVNADGTELYTKTVMASDIDCVANYIRKFSNEHNYFSIEHKNSYVHIFNFSV
jgi:hypothetical protein